MDDHNVRQLQKYKLDDEVERFLQNGNFNVVAKMYIIPFSLSIKSYLINCVGFTLGNS